MNNYTIRPICTGYQFLDKAQYATFRRGDGEIIQHPVFAFLIEGDGRKILVDTGMSDTERSVKYHHDGRQDPGQAIHEQLASLGVGLDEIEIIIFTHLHWDHCANLEKFPRAKLYVSDREYRFALNPIPFYAKSYEHPSLGIGCEARHHDRPSADCFRRDHRREPTWAWPEYRHRFSEARTAKFDDPVDTIRHDVEQRRGTNAEIV